MVTEIELREIINQVKGIIEQPHFEKTSFRINKKIFLPFNKKLGIVTVKMNDIQQSVYCSVNKDWIYPVSNKWENKVGQILILKTLIKQY